MLSKIDTATYVYPSLMFSKELGIIVLFPEPYSGVIVGIREGATLQINKKAANVGDKIEGCDMTSYYPYSGTVTLSN